MSDEPEYELVFPFIVVTSKGGPYDDDAYAAGWEAATFEAEIANIPVGKSLDYSTTVRTDNVPQCDLIAMKYGWRMFSRNDDVHVGWSYIRFCPTEAQP